MGCRVLGLFRDILTFSLFGVGMMNSAFLFGFTLPNLFRRLLGEGALSSAFIPVFSHEIEGKGKTSAYKFLNQVISWVGLALILIVLIGVSTLYFISKIAIFETRWYLAFEFGIILLPYMIFVCLAAVLGSVLNVQGRFIQTSLSQVWLNLSMIIFLIIGAYYLTSSDYNRILFLCAGIIFGGILQLLIPAISLIYDGWRPRLDFSVGDSVKELSRLLIPGLGGAAIFQVNIVISRLLAMALNNEAVSVLYLANRLMELPLGVFTIAVLTVVFPAISRSRARGDQCNIEAEYGRGLRLIFAITIPAAFGLSILSVPILSLLFEWGVFSVKDVDLTAAILVIYSLGLPFYSLATFATRGFHSLKDMKTPFQVGIRAVILNFIFSIIFMNLWGMKGLATANVLVVAYQSLVLHLKLKFKEKAFHSPELIGALYKIILASAAMALFTWSAWNYVTFFFQGIKLQSIIIVSGGIPASIFLYFLVLKLLKYKDLASLKGIIRLPRSFK